MSYNLTTAYTSIMNSFAAWLLLFLYLAFASSSWRATLTRLSNIIGDWMIALLILPYLLAVNFHLIPSDLLRYAIFLALPTLLLRFRPQKAKAFDIFQILAILAIWVPLETDLFLLFGNLLLPKADLASTLQLLPKAEATLVSGVDLPVHSMTAILLALLLFLIRHPLQGIGFTFSLRKEDLRNALIAFLGFALIGIPTGFMIGFLRYNLTLPNLTELFSYLIGGYLLIALMEEILFRGIIQNLLTKRVGNETIALLIASIIFGMGHLNNASRGFSAPNWGYVLMAGIAGIAYGWAWQKTKKVTASAITHMLVNLMWAVFF